MAIGSAYNEQIKFISNTLQNFGTALTIALIGVWWADGFHIFLAIWGFGAILLFASAYSVLRNLEDSD